MEFSSTNQWLRASPPTSGKFCSAKALAMLWSSVQLMASAIASTPRQLAAVSCFSGDHQESNGAKVGERTRDRWRGRGSQNKRLIKTETKKNHHHSNIYNEMMEVKRRAAAGSRDLRGREKQSNNWKQLREQRKKEEKSITWVQAGGVRWQKAGLGISWANLKVSCQISDCTTPTHTQWSEYMKLWARGLMLQAVRLQH